jgi:intracellular sulfur oxidation DsrE/DsrF family protein
MKQAALLCAAVVVLSAGTVRAQSAGSLPIPGVDPARDVPGAHVVPDAATTYKVLFDFDAPLKPTEAYPALEAVARYVNTLAKLGVPADHRRIAIIFHQGSTDLVMNNQAYKARYEGHDNPNIAMVQALKKAGVEMHVCGQAVTARKIDPKTIQPEIQLDLWALTTIIDFVQRGYVKIGG